MNYKQIIIITTIMLMVCGTASATTHTVCASGCDYTTIQAAVTAASAYDTVYVYNGTYNENVDISTAHLTLEGEGRDVVTVTAASSSDHVFYISADYVNISGFGVNGASGIYMGGIYLDGVEYCNIAANNASNNHGGIYLVSSSNNNTLTSNTANSNGGGGIYLTSSSNNTLTSNTANSNNYYGIYLLSSSNNNLTSNTASNNLHALSYLQTDSQEGTIGTQIDFNFTMNDTNDNNCPTCSYNLDLFPSEANLQHSPSGATITGNFTPTRKGIYSLRVNVTDADSNSEIRKYVYLINATLSSVDYYFRHVLATHGQPTSYGTDHDAGAFLFNPPISDEEVYCGIHVGVSVDSLPDNLFGIIEDVNYSIWYKNDADGYTGIQRYGDASQDVDLSISVDTTPKTFDTFNFIDINWTSDYFWAWYWFAVKLNGYNPYIYSNATNPSYMNITYSHSTTPAIKSISNEDILLLSATSPESDSTNASIVVDGTGSTHLVVQMPNTALTYTATWDGGACTGGDCSFTQSSGELNFTLNLGSEHTINISEAGTGTNDITLGANKYGMLRKDVTAAQTFSTIASGFTHDVCFTWWDDVTDTWLSYWVGDSYNSGQSVPKDESYFVLMDSTGETVSCSVASAATVAIPSGWSVTYLRESDAKTLSAIKTDMGGNCDDLYAWDHTASGTGAWTNTGTYSVLPNQGLLVSASSSFNWDGSVS